MPAALAIAVGGKIEMRGQPGAAGRSAAASEQIWTDGIAPAAKSASYGSSRMLTGEVKVSPTARQLGIRLVARALPGEKPVLGRP